MNFWKFLAYACFLCVVKISCCTVFASDSEDDSDTDAPSAIEKKQVLSKQSLQSRSSATDSDSDSDDEDEKRTLTAKKMRKSAAKSVLDRSSMTVEDRLLQLEGKITQHDHRIAQTEGKTEEHDTKITTINGQIGYISGGMTDFSKNIRTNLPLLVSGATSLCYLAIAGYQAGYLDLGTTLSIFVYSYTILGMIIPQMCGMINTPLNKR